MFRVTPKRFNYVLRTGTIGLFHCHDGLRSLRSRASRRHGPAVSLGGREFVGDRRVRVRQERPTS